MYIDYLGNIPPVLSWEFPWSFSCVALLFPVPYYPHSLFLVFWNFHCGISWCGFIFSIVLSTTWTLLIWRRLSFRLRNFLELFLLISLASPFDLVFYYLSWAFIIWMLKLLEWWSLLSYLLYLFPFALLSVVYPQLYPPILFWVFNFCNHILYLETFFMNGLLKDTLFFKKHLIFFESDNLLYSKLCFFLCIFCFLQISLFFPIYLFWSLFHVSLDVW